MGAIQARCRPSSGNSSDTAKRAAYGAAAERAIESQRKVLEEAKSIREAKAIA
ncbi:TPA: hypothetical protein L5P25_003172 [Pseudomonas aeruginosa]|uniref:hypothetical protein n=1 Tax=Pseudomonas aeruginosa group TaxID=136841 RepID=UPI0012985E59|nr:MULTISPECIES: hypothetical protein [Pseudomonas aeruginosa group]MBG4032860.1 hypothetical protein [Pseudomonas aeruginosa]MBG4067585.1 hypothetical protein [Pseudomonas aeruginosa]MBG4436185.1 hypothetical protein [Pseudomonas aeruginosa]MBG4675403.1 hypothetical protein [Pseudomonas aeruginosa]MBG4948607.1 hypothetical protein [Pseudomonas aeruginosa]